MEQIIWRVEPRHTPQVARRCSKCGAMATFVSSDKFRVNANKRMLDVWLVYKCLKCDNTWNLTILSRVNAGQLDPELYYGFEKNDKALAWRYAFNQEVLSKAAAAADFDGVEFDVEGDMAVLGEEPLEMRVVADYAIPIRLDKVLVRMTGLSRSRLKALAESGALRLSNDKDVNKARFDGDVTIYYTPPQAK